MNTTFVLGENSYTIPLEYFKAKPLPEDPAGSIVFEKDTDASTGILMFFYIDKSEALPFDDDQGLIDCLHGCLGEKQGLVEVKSGKTAKGIPYVYTVVKSARQPSGVQYILTYQEDFGEYVLNLQGYFNEESVTGMRDTAIYAYAMQQGIITSDDKSKWCADPYRPDFKSGLLMNLSEQECFDEAFPKHPLSELRKFVNFFIQAN